MLLEDLESLGFDIEQVPRPESTLNMKKVLCLCHYKWVWVEEHEPLPYYCSRKELHASLAE